MRRKLGRLARNVRSGHRFLSLASRSAVCGLRSVPHRLSNPAARRSRNAGRLAKVWDGRWGEPRITALRAGGAGTSRLGWALFPRQHSSGGEEQVSRRRFLRPKSGAIEMEAGENPSRLASASRLLFRCLDAWQRCAISLVTSAWIVRLSHGNNIGG